MGCTMCEHAENNGDKYYYRWGVANVLVVGCQAHVKEIFSVLSTHQLEKKEPKDPGWLSKQNLKGE